MNLILSIWISTRFYIFSSSLLSRPLWNPQVYLHHVAVTAIFRRRLTLRARWPTTDHEAPADYTPNEPGQLGWSRPCLPDRMLFAIPQDCVTGMKHNMVIHTR